jgi:hypothetical protein
VVLWNGGGRFEREVAGEVAPECAALSSPSHAPCQGGGDGGEEKDIRYDDAPTEAGAHRSDDEGVPTTSRSAPTWAAAPPGS